MIHDILSFFKDLFYLKYLPKLGGDTSLSLLFLFGLLTSIHCIGMCGGIILTQCVHKHENDGIKNNKIHNILLSPAVFYNIGRIISYTVIGGIVGAIGQVLTLSGVLKGIIPIISGIFMIIMAINILGIFPILKYLNISMPKFIAKKITYKYNSSNPLIIGILTGLMPCGPIQMIQLYALSTRSFIHGAISSFIFVLGTVPGLFIFSAFSIMLSKKFSKYILKFSALVVAILGIIMIGRGFALNGIVIPSFSVIQNKVNSYTISTINGNVQTVTTSIGKDYFTPIEVKKGVKVRWTIKVPKDVYNDCNNAIEIPEYNIEKNFVVGDNIVEFTPDKEGEFIYTCWMGMIKSKIKVVQGSSSSSNKDLQQNNSLKLDNSINNVNTENEKSNDVTEKQDTEILIGWISSKNNLLNNPVNNERSNLLHNDSYVSGLGIIPYIEGKNLDSYTSLDNFIFFDAESNSIARNFMENLPTGWEKNITVKITAYKVNNIPTNDDETRVPENDPSKIDHCLNGIHITKIEAANINGISTNKLP